MPRVVFSLLIAWGVAFPGSVQAEDDVLDQALALQKTLQKAITAAEPSIACILVSRSEAYQRAAGPKTSADTSGKLGDFDPREFLGEEKSKEERDLLRRKFDLADPGYVPEAFGSGVVIDRQGLILTNYHVIRDATKIFVRLPGDKSGYADIHAADPRSDLAVLRIRNSRVLPLQPLALGDGGAVQRGQFVLTLANPFAAGFRDGQPSASWGIISNVRRHVPGLPREEERTKPLHYYGTLLQTDTRLSLGSSGGALLNLSGELIGLTTALAAIHGGEAPGGFAIPLDTGLRRILDVLKRGEEVEYGFLGVGFNEQRPRAGRGVAVEYVTQGSPAEQEAHLAPSDIILAVNGVPIKESDDLFLHLGTQLAGSKITLNILQAVSKETRSVDATLGKFHVIGKRIFSSLGNRPFFRGLRVDYTTLLVQQAPRLPLVPPGVLISDVQAASAAADVKLKAGEGITHVNRRPVSTPAAFYQAVAALQGPIELQLYNFYPV